MQKHEMSEKTRKLLAALSIVVFVLFCAAVFWFVGRPMVRFASEPEQFREWIDARGIWGRVAFVGMTVLQIVVAVIPGEALELGAGYAFGAIEGTLLCQLGVAIGTALVFLFVRSFGVRALEVFFSLDKINSMKFLRDTDKLYALCAAVFFIPGTPKDLITYFLGLTKIKLLPLVLISTFARLPSIVTSTLVGSSIGDKNYTVAIIVFIATLVIIAAGLLIYRRISRGTLGDNAAEQKTQSADALKEPSERQREA